MAGKNDYGMAGRGWREMGGGKGLAGKSWREGVGGKIHRPTDNEKVGPRDFSAYT